MRGRGCAQAIAGGAPAALSTCDVPGRQGSVAQAWLRATAGSTPAPGRTRAMGRPKARDAEHIRKPQPRQPPARDGDKGSPPARIRPLAQHPRRPRPAGRGRQRICSTRCSALHIGEPSLTIAAALIAPWVTHAVCTTMPDQAPAGSPGAPTAPTAATEHARPQRQGVAALALAERTKTPFLTLMRAGCAGVALGNRWLALGAASTRLLQSGTVWLELMRALAMAVAPLLQPAYVTGTDPDRMGPGIRPDGERHPPASARRWSAAR